MRIEELLQSNVYDVDEKPHIKVDQEKCSKCNSRPCLLLCPARCYTLMDEKVMFSHEGCLECGTCRLICPEGAIEWNYPVSGKGIHYRFG
ncbi:MAG: ferredoxin family protein [Thermoproteota archaeon]|jgi:ferredoxin like protein|uniref:Ferredoxin family protein n=1 Tax=Candidatus Methanodesulfokora washburnensis TaxID=2478471 RepID=A0A429GXV9_9CREN|nr:4Fe-4S dicluster domain-containing protein [Candidatus Methanodesulfokores washburnensis]RSN78719.1 ferredoxin family protein [Candidatus Methanodesulfokores washburnensis]RZN59835.1 MAG: ferredoxin family protein [Candidatus Methanodesulfokores washburnensis]TDA41040.1 MAG: ferredoxin family protein [Candidatus Korarchaeota archaeon]